MTYLYRAYDAGDRLLYVGVTDRLERRFKQHRADARKSRDQLDHYDLTEYPDRESALVAEAHAAIDDEWPIHNEIDRPRSGSGTTAPARPRAQSQVSTAECAQYPEFCRFETAALEHEDRGPHRRCGGDPQRDRQAHRQHNTSGCQAAFVQGNIHKLKQQVAYDRLLAALDKADKKWKPTGPNTWSVLPRASITRTVIETRACRSSMSTVRCC